jgi:hypothetical protein
MVGLTGNFVAIPILLSKRLASSFNRILVCLAVFDNVFIICSLLVTTATQTQFYKNIKRSTYRHAM